MVTLAIGYECQPGRHTSHYVFRELAITSIAIIFYWTLETAAYAEASATYEAIRAKLDKSIVLRLLSTTCDATVHLDSELYISEPAPTLACLLFINAAGVRVHRGVS